jgi:predicted Ser/Thr protein kinase
MDGHLQEDLRAWLGDSLQRESALLSAGYQGSAYLYKRNGESLVIKQAGGGLLTGWFHRRMLMREARVYQRLEHVNGVPHSLGLLDDTWLVLQFIAGDSLKQARILLQDPENFYNRLRDVVTACHEAGVAHGDLKRKENILVAAGEAPYVIDFGTALLRDGGLFDRLLFRFMRRLDYNAWIKLKYHRNYAAISAEDKPWYRPTLVERSFRVTRRIWRALSFRKARKHHQHRRNKR